MAGAVGPNRFRRLDENGAPGAAAYLVVGRTTRVIARDWFFSFEGRRYYVPDAKRDERVELVLGATELEVHSLLDGRGLARHERGRPHHACCPTPSRELGATRPGAPRCLTRRFTADRLTATRRRSMGELISEWIKRNARELNLYGLADTGDELARLPRVPRPREQRLLQQVLGVLRRPDDPIDVQQELTPIQVGQRAERPLVAGTRTRQGLLGHARIISLTLPFAVITCNDVGRLEIRRSVFVAAGASTNAASSSPTNGEPWERS
jgi:hypothetical protein